VPYGCKSIQTSFARGFRAVKMFHCSIVAVPRPWATSTQDWSTNNIDDGMDGIVSVEQTRGQVNSHSTNILIVEDNLTTLLALESLLQSDGYVVHTADGYQTALEVAKRNRLDLAICDINLWDGDGCDLLEELQKLQTVKAIAVTGYTLPEETEHYRDAGFGVVLNKPIQHSEILAAIASLHTLKESQFVSPVIEGRLFEG
jgi:CheY-like chemotaxis protein